MYCSQLLETRPDEVYQPSIVAKSNKFQMFLTTMCAFILTTMFAFILTTMCVFILILYVSTLKFRGYVEFSTDKTSSSIHIVWK